MKEKINLLDVIPYKRKYIRTETEDGLSVIAYPRFKHSWMQKFLLFKGFSPYIRVRLEEHGTAVWEAIDGQRSMREIISLLAGHFEDEDKYEERVCLYITQLQKDGFIGYKC